MVPAGAGIDGCAGLIGILGTMAYETYTPYSGIMSEMPVSDARQHLSDVVNRAAYSGEAVYLTRRGRRLAAVVPVEMLEAMEAAQDAADVAAAREALAEDGPIVSLADFRAQLGMSILSDTQ